jgi:5-methyltetrahydrofolate--homocysteine methyltransferase
MSGRLRSALAGRGVLLADGAMGTSLFAQGLVTGDNPELWNVAHPERVEAVHAGFVAAGADIVLSNSFGGNRYRLKLHGHEHRVRELNLAAARLARRVADEAGRAVLVAGSIGPTGEILAPLGPLDPAAAEEAFAEQAAALAEGGADVLWVETMSAAEELQAAIRGAARAGLEVVATMSFDTGGRTMMGLTPADAVRLAARLATPPVAFGANCGVGPGQLVASILEMRGTGAALPLVAKGNCGIPEYRDGHIHYSGDAATMARYAELARDAGASVIGGCCGTTAAHLAAMRRALDATARGEAPDLAAIESALGALGPQAAGRGMGGRERRRARAG